MQTHALESTTITKNYRSLFFVKKKVCLFYKIQLPILKLVKFVMIKLVVYNFDLLSQKKKKNKDSRRRVVAYINLVIKAHPNQAQVFHVQLNYKLNPPIHSLNLGLQITAQPAFLEKMKIKIEKLQCLFLYF